MIKAAPKPDAVEPIDARVLIVEARFYEDLSAELQKGAVAHLEAAGVEFDVIAVPGALEIPGAIAIAEDSGDYDGYVALGVVIRGETSHYDIVAGESARGLMLLTLQGMCLGNGILTCDTADQAWARARVGEGNKGAAAAAAAISLIRLRRHFGYPE